MIENVVDWFEHLDYPIPRDSNTVSDPTRYILDCLIAQLILEKGQISGDLDGDGIINSVDAEVEHLVEEARQELSGWLGWAET